MSLNKLLGNLLPNGRRIAHASSRKLTQGGGELPGGSFLEEALALFIWFLQDRNITKNRCNWFLLRMPTNQTYPVLPNPW